ncbi:chorismate synthase [Arcanobacterium phocisimile]|uniref:Chorismate synthase n=1 Tax=Arcanobacterium phocisimile TaxID=1302235 RepID=A0ABX7IKI6_9ACTO|nr:chorismate synthase [Arcanobacterium phocisimile]QRV02939.1 chorismate synthase [Arcanobacterium phocisimile]
MIRWSTAGESHGRSLIALIEGIPAGVELSTASLEHELRRRREGYGRGARQRFEQDRCVFLSGLRHGKTLGSPITIEIHNSEWAHWELVMNPDEVDPEELQYVSGQGDPRELARNRPLTRPRPGHADFPGMLKFDFSDARNVLERASARETAARVALGYVAKELLRQVFGVVIGSRVIEIGSVAAQPHTLTPEELPVVEASPVRCLDPEDQALFIAEIDAAKRDGDTLGGVVEVLAWNVPIGVGNYAVWSERLDTQLSAALMSIPSVKGVEIGDGFASARRPGSRAHDEIYHDDSGYIRSTNHAGGIEGGMSNGEPIVARIGLKPISTVPHALQTVDLETGDPATAIHQRSDTTAVVPAAVIAESMMALTLMSAVSSQIWASNVSDLVQNFSAYQQRIATQLAKGLER